MEATNVVLQQSADVVRAMHSATNPGDVDDSPVYITVSFDGTWQKRGHMSMHGVAAVIDIMTGLVVDYEVLSMYCHSCSLKKAHLGADTAVFAEWYATHRDDCSVNYHGSSNAMEVEAAKRLWLRSVHTRGLMYTGMLGDGDSKAYQAVVDLEPYGPDVTIEREECVNHAHKRMGTALLKLEKLEKLGGRGPGRLTKQTALKLQQYYRGAIMGGGDEDSMRSRVWVTLFHCMSTDDDPHHTRCPQSWCFYQQALAEDQEPPPHEGNIKYPLAYDVAEAMVPVYKRMSDPNLLKRLVKGKMQNSNESLHSVIWGCFSAGACQLTQVMELLAIEVNEVSHAYVEENDSQRICQLDCASTRSAKVARKGRAEKRKQGPEPGRTILCGRRILASCINLCKYEHFAVVHCCSSVHLFIIVLQLLKAI